LRQNAAPNWSKIARSTQQHQAINIIAHYNQFPPPRKDQLIAALMSVLTLEGGRDLVSTNLHGQYKNGPFLLLLKLSQLGRLKPQHQGL